MKLDFKLKYSKKRALRFEFGLSKYDLTNAEKIQRNIQHKVFAVGFGKTGTTSLESALKGFGYKMGNQGVGEILAEDWHNGRADRIINFCHTANAFQDMPFGMPNLFKELDAAFPKSKFILTVRDDEDVWFNSLVNYHSKLFSKGNIPSEEELKNALYRHKGWSLEVLKFIFEYPEIPLYEEAYYKSKYLNHNQSVIEYFSSRPDDLLVLNVSNESSYRDLANFLNVEVDKNATFPWKNKT